MRMHGRLTRSQQRLYSGKKIPGDNRNGHTPWHEEPTR